MKKGRPIDLSGKDDKLKIVTQKNGSQEFSLYDYLDVKDGKRINSIKEWSLSLQKGHRARLDSKVDLLLNTKYGHESGINNLPPKLLTDTADPNIKEIRVNCDVALRLFLCRGPFSMNREATLLAGAFERDSRYVPSNILDISDRRRSLLLEDQTRRTPHERFG